MTLLAERLKKSVTDGLRYRSIRTCTEWAKRFRVMGKPFPGPYDTKYHPWVKEMMDWDGSWVGPKSSQMGYTEVALNRTFFSIDINKVDVIYLLPKADPDASDFSAARFTPALELSPHLKSLFTEANNVGYKRAGAVSLYIRGMQSRSGVKSLPAGLMIFDELDEMPKDNVELAMHRTSGQQSFQIIKISTPTVPGHGIDKDYQTSTKEHFFFKCPRCSKFTELVYPDCIIITAESLLDPRINESHYICKECKGVLNHESKIEWLNTNPEWVKTENFDSEIRGWHIHRMYSMAASGSPVAFAKEKIAADIDPTSEQEFNNSVLGRAYVVKGAKVELEALNRCLKNYSRKDMHPIRGFRVMGIDVGTWLHYEIGEYTPEAGLTTDLNVLSNYKQITAGTVAHFEEIDPLMRDYQILACVIDANPEKRKARELQGRFPGHVFLCYYGNNHKGKQVNLNEEAKTITVDRTEWMDLAMGRFNSSRIALPRDTSEEYKNHIQNVVRKYDRDPTGNPVGVWVNTGSDHFAHARTYNEIALPIAATMTSNKNIKNFL